MLNNKNYNKANHKLENSDKIDGLNEKFDSKEKNDIILEKIELDAELIKLNRAIMERNNLLEENINHITTLNSEIKNFARTKPYKLAYFIRKFKLEFVDGNFHEKKVFIKWIFNRLFNTRYKVDNNHKSNILFNILKSNRKELMILNEKILDFKTNNSGETYQKKKQDIIFFSIISWNDRYQRPQHIAKSFSDDNYSVYYFDADFNSSIIKLSKISSVNIIKCKHDTLKNVRWLNKHKDIIKIISQVEEVISKNLIKDAIIFVEFPTWEPVVSYLKKKYGYKIVFDYLDEFEGFATTNNDLKNRIGITSELLKEESDLIVATSNYLYNKIKIYPNTALIRNGTEVNHFLEVSRHNVKNIRPVIGYIGVIAYWFAFDLILFAIKDNPDYDFVFVGDYSTVDISKIKELPNVKFLGEKKYEDLPDYLKSFDVCLIPFDPSLNLIKATNPVKFYEYLSSGKKIVATEIPELEKYGNQYVLLSNDPQKFSDYIRICINGTDPLLPKEKRIEFAMKHDWKERQQSFSKEINKLYPLVSILIFTYNKAAFLKTCIERIVENTKYPNYEIIVVDDGFKDGTQLYINSIKDIRVKYLLNKKMLGFAKSYNIGVNSSNGQFIILLNNDNVVNPGWISKLIINLENRNEIGMTHPINNKMPKENINSIDLNEIENFDYEYEELYFDIKFTENLSIQWFILNRKIMNQIGSFNEELGIETFEEEYIDRIKENGYIWI